MTDESRAQSELHPFSVVLDKRRHFWYKVGQIMQHLAFGYYAYYYTWSPNRVDTPRRPNA